MVDRVSHIGNPRRQCGARDRHGGRFLSISSSRRRVVPIMGAVVRLRAFPALLVLALACAAPAAAAGPVFVVVPTTSSPTRQSLHGDRHALAGAKQERRRLAVALAHARTLAASAPLLSDRLDAEKAAFQLQSADSAVSGNVSLLERQVSSLEADAQSGPSGAPDAAAAPPAAQVASPYTPAFDPLSLSPASGLGVRAVQVALGYLGVPYRWGGADPITGFDCSGLVQFVYAQVGVRLNHYTGTQFMEGAPVPDGQLRPGDLVFFEPGVAGPGHVGIYAGGDEFVEAPHTGDVVKVASLAAAKAQLGYVGAVRPYSLPSGLGVLGL
jgi:cell wall-associated NlpC family hydrolase